jgi:hypothetical protein
MQMYNKEYEKYDRITEITYFENVVVEKGFCEVKRRDTVQAMKRLGFTAVEDGQGEDERKTVQKEPVRKRRPGRPRKKRE